MSLLKPTLYVNKVTDITPELLNKLGVKSIILDVDDTIAAHHSKIPLKGIVRWLNAMKQADMKIIIASNNYKSRVKPIAYRLGLPFIFLSLKPLPFGLYKAIKVLSSCKDKSIVIGDQIFTDILGANLSGIKSILIDPLSKPKKFSLLIKRKFENPIRNKLKKDPKYKYVNLN